MRKAFPLLFALLLAQLLALPLEAQHAEHQPTMTSFVKVETSKGDFIIGLYDATPCHRDNFLALVRKNDYDGVLFHRVIHRFMIQTGNLSTKGATATSDVHKDTTTLRLAHEIMPEELFHKRGAIGAARIGNERNPQKESSATQFYITTGNHFTDWDLDDIEAATGRVFTPLQRQVYKTEGGVPSLDGEYTVFGEVVAGFETILKIARSKTDESNRPKRDIVIKRTTIVSKPQ